jgi:Haem-binding uptake, Tiki superfamily, ChaN
MKLLIAALLLITLINTPKSTTDPTISAYLRDQSQSPTDYVMSRAASNRITILGEGHWLRQDVMLVGSLIPLFQKADIDLAAEIFPASEQSRIDGLITASKWDEKAANAVMRKASWPYQEYRDLLRTAWAANQGTSRPMKVVALGPPDDWRKELLPRGLTYDSFMADLVTRHVSDTKKRVVVYCGMHHAFTRYYQAELNNTGQARAYMDRMGNILYRRFGEQVFLITLHKAIWCGDPKQPSYCLPFGGRLDCEGVKLNRPMGFDVVASPVADLRFDSGDYYGFAHPSLRFVDYTDGYIWSGPVESFRSVTIIPLSEYAPDRETLELLTRSNPFNSEANISLKRLEELWAQQIEANRDWMTKRKWSHLVGWSSRCR